MIRLIKWIITESKLDFVVPGQQLARVYPRAHLVGAAVGVLELVKLGRGHPDAPRAAAPAVLRRLPHLAEELCGPPPAHSALSTGGRLP